MSTKASLYSHQGLASPTTHLHRDSGGDLVAAVRLDGGNLSISAHNPAVLLLIAEAFQDAARQLADQIDADAAAVSGDAA